MNGETNKNADQRQRELEYDLALSKAKIERAILRYQIVTREALSPKEKEERIRL